MQRLPDFTAWAIFAKVAERGAFAAAASELGLSKGTVSKAVARLEAHLGRPLFHRSTRRLVLTEAGREALVGAARILAAGQEAEGRALADVTTMRGTIRLAAPISFGVGHLAPLLPGFLEANLEVAIELHLSDAQVDLAGEGFDMALRIAALENSRLRARPLCQLRRQLVASPAYLARHGRPTRPHDLERHACLGYLSDADRWRFRHLDGAEVWVAPQGPLRADNAEALAMAVREGLGLALLPEFLVWEDLLTGSLEALMPDWSPPGLALHMLTPPSSLRPPHVEALGAYLARRLGKAPWAIAD